MSHAALTLGTLIFVSVFLMDVGQSDGLGFIAAGCLLPALAAVVKFYVEQWIMDRPDLSAPDKQASKGVQTK